MPLYKTHKHSQHPHAVPADLSHFWVITVISNPVRYHSRYRLYAKFEELCAAAGVRLVTVEQAFGHRDFMVTEIGNPHHVQIRGHDELWIKEKMMDLGLKRIMHLDPHAREVAWIDADVAPMAPPLTWFTETWHALQHFEFVQMFKFAQDVCPNYNPIGAPAISFMASYFKSGYKQPNKLCHWTIDGYTKHGHPGYAWAANVQALNAVGGFITTAILGAADTHMAMGLLGCMGSGLSKNLSPGYLKLLLEWEKRAERYIKRDVGFVDGGIYHYFHGKKKNRGYVDRWKILIDNKFDPHTDLKEDAQGMWQLESFEPRQLMLRDQIRTYFRSRNEDSIDLE